MAIFTLLTLTGGAITGAAFARQATKRKRLYQLVASPAKRPSTPPSLSVRAREAFTRIETIRHAWSGQTRQQYHDQLGQTDDIDKAERRIQINLLASMGCLVGSTVALWGFPMLNLPIAGVILYLVRDELSTSYHAIVHEQKMDYRVMYSLSMGLPLLVGQYWIMSFSGVIWFASMYMAHKTENQAKQTVTDLFGGQIRSVWLLVDGQEVEVSIEQVQAGDVIVVQAGQMVPVDGTIVHGMASIDQHRLTGEAQPVEKEVGDSVMASTIVLSGNVHIEISQAGGQTVAAQIGQMLNQTDDFRATLLTRAELFANRLVWPTLGLSALALPLTGSAMASVAVIWCYPGWRMVLYGPLSMLSFMHVAAQQGILVKDGRSLEQLYDVDTIIFDKTGTLTLEQPTIGRIFSYNGLSETAILRYAAAAETKQSHPIALAILQAARLQQIALPTLEDAAYKVGYGLKVRVEGHTVRVGSRRFIQLEGLELPPSHLDQRAECDALGHSLVLVAVDEQVAGAIELQPTIRAEAKAIVSALHERGIETAIISGDQTAPTRRLAGELGIERFYAEVLPEDKSNFVQQLQAEGRKVCFVGDGINDAIALKAADVSVSLRGATTIATDVAQIVFMDGTLNQLPPLFELAEEFQQNMQINFGAAFFPNALSVAGIYALGWRFFIPTMLFQLSVPVAAYNALRPLIQTNQGQLSSAPPATPTSPDKIAVDHIG